MIKIHSFWYYDIEWSDIDFLDFCYLKVLIYTLVYLEQNKKGEGYGVYVSIKSQVPDIQRHAPSKTFKFYFWWWFSVAKFGLTFKINHWRMLISRFLAKFWFQNTSKEIWWAGKFYLNPAKHSEVKLCEGLIRKCYVLI